jgi:hypothetical protein
MLRIITDYLKCPNYPGIWLKHEIWREIRDTLRQRASFEARKGLKLTRVALSRSKMLASQLELWRR